MRMKLNSAGILFLRSNGCLYQCSRSPSSNRWRFSSSDSAQPKAEDSHRPRPESPWMSSHSLDAGFWNDRTAQRQFFDWAAQQMGIRKMEDWYSVKTTSFYKLSGAESLLRHKFGSSFSKALVTMYPEHKWEEWRFLRVPKGFWSKQTNIRRYLDWLAPRIQVCSKADWYNVSIEQFRANKGESLADLIWKNKHKRSDLDESEHIRGASDVDVQQGDPPPPASLVEIMRLAYPEHEWNEFSFKNIPKNFWKDPQECRKFLLNLQAKLGWADLSQFYKLTKAMLIKHDGQGILSAFNGSPAKMLKFAFPEHDWLPWKFAKRPQNLFDDPIVLRKFFSWIGPQLGVSITSPEEWLKVSASDIKRVGGKEAIWKPTKKVKSLQEALRIAFPELQWPANGVDEEPAGKPAPRTSKKTTKS